MFATGTASFGERPETRLDGGYDFHTRGLTVGSDVRVADDGPTERVVRGLTGDRERDVERPLRGIPVAQIEPPEPSDLVADERHGVDRRVEQVVAPFRLAVEDEA